VSQHIRQQRVELKSHLKKDLGSEKKLHREKRNSIVTRLEDFTAKKRPQIWRKKKLQIWRRILHCPAGSNGQMSTDT
jgi:hypothetical protein